MTNISTERLEEMRRCPFCGVSLVLTEQEELVHPWDDVCPADDIHIHYRDEPRINAWNRRSLDKGEVVKPLEWDRDRFPGYSQASSTVGTYRAYADGTVTLDTKQVSYEAGRIIYETEVAAQADYASRVTSALLPKATAPVVSEPVATIDRAMDCESWPKWLGDLVEFAMQASDAADMSTEQVIAYAILHHSAAPQPQPKAVTEEDSA